jgi:hypothetical protein
MEVNQKYYQSCRLISQNRYENNELTNMLLMYGQCQRRNRQDRAQNFRKQ